MSLSRGHFDEWGMPVVAVAVVERQLK